MSVVEIMLKYLKYLCFTGTIEDVEEMTRQINVLLVVVTDSELSWSTEIENITRFVHCTVVSGNSISWDRVQNSIRDEHVDIIHFVCHSDERGINLNEEIIEPTRLLGLCKNSNTRVVFFSSCTSVKLGQLLVEEGVPATISYVSEIGDKRALSVATDFYQALSRDNATAKEAYNIANPGTAELIWLSNGKYAETEANEILVEAKAIASLILWWLRVIFYGGLSWFILFLYFWLQPFM